MTETLSIVISWLDRLGLSMFEWWLWMNVWTAALCVAAFLVDRLLRHRVAASWRLLLFVAVLARVFMPVQMHSPVGALPSATAALEDVRSHVSGRVVQESPSTAPAMATPSDRQASAALTPSALIPVAYALGVLFLMAAWVRAMHRLRGIVHSSHALDDHQVQAMARWMPRVSVTHVREHPSAGPLLIGVFTPTLVLPERLFRTLDDEALAAVLRHEQAHCVRRDPILAVLLHLVVIAAWPVIAIWLSAGRVRQLMELACDERALEGAGSAVRKQYGRALIEFASGRRVAPVGLTFAGGLHERMAALKQTHRWRRGAQAAVTASVAVLLVACAGERTSEIPSTAQTVDSQVEQLHPTAIEGASLAPHKGATELTITVLDGVPRHPKLDPLGDASRNGQPNISELLSTGEFESLLSQSDCKVLARPRMYVVLGLPARIEVGSSGADGVMSDGVAIDARVAMIVKEPDATEWTHQLELSYAESRGGTTIIGPARRALNVKPGETAVSVIAGPDRPMDRLLCISARPAPDAPQVASQSAPPPQPQTAQSFQPAPAPFDPLDGEYPQVLWMFNVYEVPGPLEVSSNGIVTTTTKAKPNTFASIEQGSIDAAFASINALPRRTQVATPALIAKFDVEARVKSESRDKAGQDLSGRSIAVRAAHGKVGIEATVEVTVVAGNFSIAARVANRSVMDDGAIVMATPGPGASDPWTVMVGRPRVIHSLKEYPFQTDSGPER